MHILDWLITFVPLGLIVATALYSRRFVRGIVDYLAAGRLAGRYVICAGDVAAGLSVIMLVASSEANYHAGIAVSFWGNISVPLGVLLSLTGFCVYRFRATRALSFGQFLEERYSRRFRIFASTIRGAVDLMCNALSPAIAANFFIYFFNLPHRIQIFGINLPCFTLIVAAVVLLAIVVIWPSGRISLLITDAIQGILCYPIFAILVGYIIWNFSWGQEMMPVLLARVPGESFVNPYDIDHLRDFNLFATTVGLFSYVFNRGSFIGNDTSTCGKTPHEQKMAGVLGAWRNGLAYVFFTLVAILMITVMNSGRYAEMAERVRLNLIHRTVDQTVASPERLRQVDELCRNIELPENFPTEYSQSLNRDTPYCDAVHSVLADSEKGRVEYQKFQALYRQQMLPMVLRELLPVGLCGLFGLLMVMLLLSTDDSRIFNATTTIVQDVILPNLKGAVSPRMHLLLLRLTATGVGLFFFICALFFEQMDYINMFFTMLLSLWLGGAGSVVIFGLYWRRGTTQGAYTAVFMGSGITLVGLLLQRNWADRVYPFLERYSLVDTVAVFLKNTSAPFNPYIVWEMNPQHCPINSYEFFFMAMLASIFGYVIVSLLTCRQPCDFAALFHWNETGEVKSATEQIYHSPLLLLKRLVGITSEYTRSDRFIAWGVFLYSFVYAFGLAFVGVIVWNLFAPWPAHWWGYYFFLTALVIPGLIAVISTVWFSWGGTRDLIRLFRDLQAQRQADPHDNGQVIINKQGK